MREASVNRQSRGRHIEMRILYGLCNRSPKVSYAPLLMTALPRAGQEGRLFTPEPGVHTSLLPLVNRIWKDV